MTNQANPDPPTPSGIDRVSLRARLLELVARSEMGFTERFEADAERFYRETGYLAPGKSVPLAMAGGYNEDERDSAWQAFNARTRDEYIALLREAAEALVPPASPTATEEEKDPLSQRYSRPSLPAGPEASSWQPIESLPSEMRDRDTIIVYAPAYRPRVIAASWDPEIAEEGGQCWRAVDAWGDRLTPTHWHPWPAPIEASDALRLQPPPDNARQHELKTWPVYFAALVSGAKTFEYRLNDRNYRDGDVLWLREWEPMAWEAGAPTLGKYTGREMRRTVTYSLSLGNGWIVMALSPGVAQSACSTPTIEQPANPDLPRSASLTATGEDHKT